MGKEKTATEGFFCRVLTPGGRDSENRKWKRENGKSESRERK
jgi:hypothetical protein